MDSMKFRIIMAVAGIFLLVGLSLTSASLCKNSYGYYESCGSDIVPGYKKYDTADRATKPIFKGSYGSYRYQQYVHNEYIPPVLFRNYGYSGGYWPFFSGSYHYPYTSYYPGYFFSYFWY